MAALEPLSPAVSASTPDPIQIGVEGNDFEAEDTMAWSFTCPACEHETETTLLLPVHPAEGIECPDCSRRFFLVPDDAGFIDRHFVGSEPTDRATARYQWMAKMEERRRRGEIVRDDRTTSLGEMNDNLDRQAAVIAYRREIVDDLDPFDPPGDEEASLMRVQNSGQYAMFSVMAATAYAGTIPFVGITVPTTIALVAILAVTVIRLVFDWQRIGESLADRGYDLSPSDLVRYDPDPLPLFWERVLGRIIETVADRVPPRAKDALA